MRICDEAARHLNTLTSVTGTLCTPTRASAPKGAAATSFLIVAPKPFFSTQKGRTAYATLACAAIGHGLVVHRSVVADEIWLTDVAAIRENQVYILPAALCRKIQPRVKSGDLSLDEMRAQVPEALRAKTVPPR